VKVVQILETQLVLADLMEEATQQILTVLIEMVEEEVVPLT
jgi:hypothetical protein